MWNDQSLEDELGDVVSKARFGMGMNVYELAIRTDLHPKVIKDIEAYKKRVNAEEAGNLARVLKLYEPALWALANDQYMPTKPNFSDHIDVVRFTFSPMGSNGYLLHVKDSGDTIMVDPGGDPASVLQMLDERHWKLDAVLITHGHDDHIQGVDEVVEKTGAAVYAHPDEWSGKGLVSVEAFNEAEIAGQPVTTITIGSTNIDVLFCPGHTRSGLTFVTQGVAFVGDTLFAGSLGRAMRGPGHYESLLQSATALLQLPLDTVLLPGHGPATTVREERIGNPFVGAGA